MTRSLFTAKSALKQPTSVSGNRRSARERILAMLKADQPPVVRPRRTNIAWTGQNRFSSNNPLHYNSALNPNFIPISTAPFGSSSIQIYDEQENKRKSKFPTKVIRKYAQDYCDGTSLHGLRYVGMDDVSIFERIFWVIAFIGAMGFSAYFISNIYDKWVLTPVIVGIDPEFKSISDIPFPAITICNMNQANKHEAEKIMAGNNEAEKVLLDDICDFEGHSNTSKDANISLSSDWEFIKKFILKVSQPCNELLVYCKWQGYEIPCRDILNSALTDEGVCCTFNRVASNFMYHNAWTLADFKIKFPPNNIDWTPENGYPANATNDTWPFRASGAGEHIGLTIISNVAASEYYCSSTSSVGLKIKLHSSVETPMMKDYGFFIHPRKEVRVAIRPTMDQADPTISSIPINKRQCFFSEEKNLFFYRTYTKLNCELECLSNHTLNSCGCVPFYLPKNLNTKICDKSKEPCYRKAKTDMDLYLRPSIVCACLPACNEISYAQDHSLGDISQPALRKAEANTTDVMSLIILHFFYQQTQFRSYRKSELFGFTEFLSNSGGLLGLFLGFSFLSAVEIFYHLTLRLWCVAYKKRKVKQNNIVFHPFTK